MESERTSRIWDDWRGVAGSGVGALALVVGTVSGVLAFARAYVRCIGGCGDGGATSSWSALSGSSATATL